MRIANNNMVNALKLVSLNRGYDPRDFTLVAFGGGGGMHGVALAQELGIRKVVVPRGASVFSAWGMMMSDLRRDYFVTRLIEEGSGPAAHRARSSRRPRRRREPSSRPRAFPASKVALVPLRQVPLPEPGALGRGPVSRRRGQRRDASRR